jgi:ubiquinone/menaquinone biosynthesis C-methylase UbiE
MSPLALDYDRIATAYARHRQVHPGVLHGLCQAVEGTSSGKPKVLEVGCGTGNYIIALQSLLDRTCWGIDLSEEMLSQARERSSPVHFQIGRAERLGFSPGIFDLVFSVDVIHHLEDRCQYVRQAWRALKTGGRICTVTDSEWIIRHRQPLAAYFPETVEIELARYPRIAELSALMTRAGFDGIVEDTVEWTYPLTDVRAYRDRAYSSLHLISEEVFQRGIERMEHDLHSGPIPCVSRYTLLWGKKEEIGKWEKL